MIKASFVAFLIVLSAVLSGCLNDESTDEDANKAPVAQIKSIVPNPAYAGQTVTFSASGSDEDGYVTGYNWGSSIDGEIDLSTRDWHSTKQQFTTNTLSVGEHTIYLKVIDDEDKWSSKDKLALTILPENHAPEGNLSVSGESADVDEFINFSAESISDSDSDELSYNWDFGDGNTSNDIKTQHNYSQPGFYEVILVVSDGKSFNGTSLFNTSISVTIANRAPQAVASSERGTKFEPDEIITFTGKDSTDPDGDVLEYFWDFDKNDGNDESVIGNITNGGEITHSYVSEGTYTVTLTVTDGHEFSTATTQITIERAANEIRAIVTTDNETDSKVMGDEQIIFTFSAADSISDSNITKYEWDFSYDAAVGFYADNETTEPEISWEFDSGRYTVKVRITNEMGETDEASYSDDVELRINYEYTETRTIDSGQQEHMVQLYGLHARYIRATLEYETISLHEDDLDLYMYNTSHERNPDEDEGSDQDEECNVCVAKNVTHNVDNIEQVNYIELDYYNSTHRAWLDEESELGDWWVVVDHERGNTEYTIKIEVIYWE